MKDLSAPVAGQFTNGLRFDRRWMPPLNIAWRMVPWMLSILTYIALVSLTVSWLQIPEWRAGNELAATLGVGIGMLMVFRNNSANDRWWEARKAWGQLINDSRNLALKASAYCSEAREEHAELASLLSDFARSLAAHVQGRPIDFSALRTAGIDHRVSHAPGYFAGRIHQLLNRWHRRGQLKDSLWVMDWHARSLMEICGVCERIRNTPLAASYRSLLRCGLSLYILLAPWSVSLEIGWWSIPVLAIGIGLLLGMELTAEAIEEPFGNEGDDLPLDAFCKSIEGFVETVLLHAPDGIWTEPTPSRMHLFQPARPTLAAAADELLLQNSGLLQCSA